MKISLIFVSIALMAPFASADGWVGVWLDEQNRVLAVCHESPAEEAGVKVGDIILAVDGEKIQERNALITRIRSAGAGAVLVLDIERDNKPITIRTEIKERPAQVICKRPLPQIHLPAISQHMHPHKVKASCLGVSVQEMTPELRQFFGAPKENGVLVARVDPDSPSAKALSVGDVIVEADGKAISCGALLMAQVNQREAGEIIRLGIVRNGKHHWADIPVTEREKTRYDLGKFFGDQLCCPMKSDNPCQHIWLWSDEDFEASIRRLENMINKGEFGRIIRERTQEQKDLEIKIKMLEEKLRRLEERLKQESQKRNI